MVNEQRDLSKITAKILDLFPPEHFMLKNGLKNQLEQLQKNVWMQPPECEQGLWVETGILLGTYLKN